MKRKLLYLATAGIIALGSTGLFAKDYSPRQNHRPKPAYSTRQVERTEGRRGHKGIEYQIRQEGEQKHSGYRRMGRMQHQHRYGPLKICQEAKEERGLGYMHRARRGMSERSRGFYNAARTLRQHHYGHEKKETSESKEKYAPMRKHSEHRHGRKSVRSMRHHHKKHLGQKMIRGIERPHEKRKELRRSERPGRGMRGMRMMHQRIAYPNSR
jgi:hypothetical protein